MARIYISSTYWDLKAERAAAWQAIQDAHHEPVGMETYGPSERQPLEVCLADVEKCDAYLGILGWRYGSSPPGEERSFTRCEYDRATELGLPHLMLLAPYCSPWKDRADADLEEIKAFRAEVQRRHTTRDFPSVEDLKYRVGLAMGEFAGREPVVPPLLPFLCDRFDQEEHLEDLLDEPEPRVKVCLAYGEDGQAIREFVDVLREHKLPRILDRRREGQDRVETYGLRWPKDCAPDRFVKEMWRQAGRTICEGRTAGKREVLDKIAQVSQVAPVLVHCPVKVKGWSRRRTALVTEFARQWSTDVPPMGGEPVILLLTVRIYKKDYGRRAREELEALAIDGGSTSDLLLPELEDVDRDAADDWARLPEVTTLARDEPLTVGIQDVYGGEAELAMVPLADGLRGILRDVMRRAR